MLKKIFEDNHIPEDAILMSDSGWECDATDMNGIYYNSNENVIVITQEGSRFEKYYDNENWSLLHSNEEAN
jgi:hypothetical protein